MQDDGLETILAATEGRVDAAQRAARGVADELKKAHKGAQAGQLRDLRRALDAAVAAADELASAAKAARDAFDFDETGYLASGAYAKELLAVAGERGVAMFEEDERLLCYPSLVRVLPSDAAIEVDRRRERRLRPSVVVDQLAAAQQRSPRFKADAFLESLLGAYKVRADASGKPDPVVRLDALWEVLTLLPGQAREYTKAEFARDLYLLDQSGVSTARSGRSLRWHASTGTRGAGVLTTVARSGQQQRYWGVSFTAV